MAITLSVKAEALLQEIGISPQIYLDIEGVELLFAARPSFKILNWDESNASWDDGLQWDGLINDGSAVDWISLDGTTNNISQQLSPDKGSTSSISTVNIAIVDKDGKVSDALSFDKITEVMGKKAVFAIGFQEGAYPNDATPIFRGVIVDFYTDSGTVMISMASSETLLRQTIFQKYQTSLTQKLKYKELTIQDILWKQRLTEPGIIKIEYLDTGSLVASYNINTKILSINIDSGVTTANEIVQEVSTVASAFFAVESEVIGTGELPQVAVAVASVETDTTAHVKSTAGFIESQDAVRSYVRINDEIMEVLSKTDLTFELVRDQLNSVPDRHESGVDLSSFYRLQGRPLDLARKLMLSNKDNAFFDSDDIPKSINFIDVTTILENAIVFDYFDIEEKTGLTVGDSVVLNSASNNSVYTIKEFGLLENGDSFIITNETLVLEAEYLSDFSYNSKWNVLPEGLAMLTSEVDVKQFDSIENAFGASFVDYDFYIKETMDDCSIFIKQEIFFPQGLYSIPRKARTSVKFVVPPFTNEVIDTITASSIININDIKQRRSAHKYLYNTFVYAYEQDSVTDKFLAGEIVLSSDSVERIPLGKKELKIVSTGLRDNLATLSLVQGISDRQSERYRFAPVYWDNMHIRYKDGFKIEVGDVIPFGETKHTDLQTGKRVNVAKLYEVINKSLNVVNGKIMISILSTNFDILARYGVFSLASHITSDSTDQRIFIIKTNDTGEFSRESDKWKPFSGLRVRVRSRDFVDDEVRTLVEVDPTNSDALLLDAPLTFTPTENHVIEVPEYDDTNVATDSQYKIRFSYQTAQAKITAVTDAKTFDVDFPDKILEESRVEVHSKDFSRDSFGERTEVLSVVGNTITLDTELSFIPVVGDFVERSSFADGGFPYLLI